MPTIELNKPITHQGETLNEVNLDLESLTAEDLIQAETEHAMTSGGVTGVAELSKTYLLHVASRAMKLPWDDVKTMSARDVSKITMEVQSFLIG